MIDNDLERECQTWLDARRPLPADDDPVWRRWLVADAETGRATLGRYRRLQEAISLWSSPPEFEISEDFVARLGSVVRPTRRAWYPARWTAAAAIVVAGVWGLRGLRDQPAAGIASGQVAYRPLNKSLSEATFATLQLARATSEPAARVGRSVFERSDWSGVAASFLPPISVEGASGALLDVGQRMTNGVRPLGGSARKAFGFLVAPVSSSAGQPMPAKPETSDRIL